MQLPQVAASGASAYLAATAEITSIAYLSLTHANSNLIETYGTPEQIKKWVTPQREGRFLALCR
jgi:hypothetical protein